MTNKTLDFLLQMTSMKGFSYFVAVSAPFPVAKLTVLSNGLVAFRGEKFFYCTYPLSLTCTFIWGYMD